ncbi:MAG TPA: MmgE/PrpD family protein [Sphingomonas sp.]|nr:MmgE/PrpD family protein [Sphingomonas sp.]
MIVEIEGLSVKIARHVAELSADAVPPGAIHAAKRALLDGVGVMLGASGLSADVTPFLGLARESAGPAPVLGCGFSSAPALAALANGAMAHALDFEDAFDAAPCHPNASLLPAALAIVAARPETSGRELLAAIAIGCDLVCRLGLSLRRPMEEGGWYPPPILGAFGAVAAAARLRRLDARQVLDAFSLMLCQVSTPGEIKYDEETVIRAIREAFPAQAAVQATALAEAGVRGFDAPFEGGGGFYRLFAGGAFDAADLVDGLGMHFWIEQLSFKRWPACRGTHAYIEAMQQLRREHGIAADDVREIVTTGGPVQRMLVEPAARKSAPATAIDAKFSIPYTIAAALLDDEVGLESFSTAALARGEAQRLARCVRFAEHPDWGRDRAASGRLELRLGNGETLAAEIDVALGHYSRPLDDAMLDDKFGRCAIHAAIPLDAGAAEALARTIWSLDDASSCNSLLCHLCYKI